MASTGSKALKAIHQRPIAFYRIYKDITNSTPAGVILSQLMYWGEKYEKFWKTDSEIMEETGVTTNELRTAKSKIKALPFIVVTREGVPATTCYAIDWDMAMQYIEDFIDSRNKISEIHETEQVHSGNDDPQFSEIHETSLVKDDNLYTKTTTKTTDYIHNNSSSKNCEPHCGSPVVNGLKCPLCNNPQFETPSGVSCKNGHGGVEGVEVVKKSKPLLKLKKIPTPLPNHHEYSPEALKIIRHWKKRGGKVYGPNARSGPEKIKAWIEELLNPGLNTCYTKVVHVQELKMKEWSVDDIIRSIDHYSVELNKPINFHFEQFILWRNHGFNARKQRDYSPLVENFKEPLDPKTKDWANKIKDRLYKKFPDIIQEMPFKTFLNLSDQLIEVDKEYKATYHAVSFNRFIPWLYTDYFLKHVAKSGPEQLHFLSRDKYIGDFLRYSVKTGMLRKKTMKDISEEKRKEMSKKDPNKEKEKRRRSKEDEAFKIATLGMNALQIERYKIKHGIV